MRRLFLFGLITLMCAAMAMAQEKGEKGRDGVLIHLSSNDPHRVVMALSMAVRMSENKDVLVYCDINGIDVVLKNAADIEYPTFVSAHSSLKKLIEKKITIFACPSCLKAAGKTGADLMPGVRTAEREAFFTFTEGRILTLDY